MIWIRRSPRTTLFPYTTLFRSLKKKGKRTARRAGNDASIEGPLRRRSAPRSVASRVVRRADPPEVFAIVGKFFAKRQAKEFVSLRGLHGILEIIRVGVAFLPEIVPGM